MARDKPTQSRPAEGKSREDRLKSALKANMARRKAQARARADGEKEERGSASETQGKEG